MKYRFLIASLALVFGLGGHTLMAQDKDWPQPPVVRVSTPLTLEQFRAMVVDYSNSLKMSNEGISAARSKVQAVRSGYAPALSLSAGANYMPGLPSFAGFTLKDYTYNASLDLKQNIYTGGAVRNQTATAKSELDIAKLNSEVTLDNVIYAADVTYWAYAASMEQIEIAKEYVRIVEALYGIVDVRFKDGYVSRTDLLMVETRLNEAKIQLTSAQKLLMTSLQDLNTMLGNESMGDYSISDSLFVVRLIDYNSTTDQALERRPDYLKAQRDVELGQQQVRLSRARFNPQIVGGIQGVYGTSNPNMTGAANLYGVVYLSLNVPIFNWGERQNTVAQAKAASRAKAYALVDTKDKVNQELTNSKISLGQSYQQAEIALKNLLISQENLELNTYSYSEGKLPILDVLQSQLSWIQAYTTSVNACYGYQISVASYYKALGRIGR